MSDPSLPSVDPSAAAGALALDYYRQRGAAIVPLSDEPAFEVTPQGGPAMKVVFARFDGPQGASPLPALTTTSPQWRAIVDDLTADVAVSYRYLTAGPIAHPVRDLQAALPTGWTITAAKLLHVENRQAVGFSHRVTFDAPALGARRETLHHHLWDTLDGERLTNLEARIYDLPCIMLRPERFPGEDVVREMQERSLAAVDEASDVRGLEMERELAEMLSEAEKRTNQYYEQQMGNVVQRQGHLTAKLDVAIRKLGEAKAPDQQARLRDEGESLAAEIGRLEMHREADMAAIEAACFAKLATERDRHELTATTDLVAVCHASFDVLTYVAKVAGPDGIEQSWELVYRPLTREVAFPACAFCTQPMELPVEISGGLYACGPCVHVCGGCGAAGPATAEVAGACQSCATAVCERCETTCHACGAASCATHGTGCATCEAPMCAGCTQACRVCDAPCCSSHAHPDARNGGVACADHRLAFTPPPAEAKAEVTAPANPLAVATSMLLDLPPLPVAPQPVVAVVDTRPSSEPPPPVFRTPRVVSKTSGKVLHPLQAEQCPACEYHFEVKEMLNCETCGVASCPLCIEGDSGPCPACDALEPIAPTDDRLAFVLAQFPELAGGRRQWEAASVGPYVLCHWSLMGTWGLVVYHRGGAEPTVLTEFRCGRIETFRQVMASWWG